MKTMIVICWLAAAVCFGIQAFNGPWAKLLEPWALGIVFICIAKAVAESPGVP